MKGKKILWIVVLLTIGVISGYMATDLIPRPIPPDVEIGSESEFEREIIDAGCLPASLNYMAYSSCTDDVSSHEPDWWAFVDGFFTGNWKDQYGHLDWCELVETFREIHRALSTVEDLDGTATRHQICECPFAPSDLVSVYTCPLRHTSSTCEDWQENLGAKGSGVYNSFDDAIYTSPVFLECYYQWMNRNCDLECIESHDDLDFIRSSIPRPSESDVIFTPGL